MNITFTSIAVALISSITVSSFAQARETKITASKHDIAAPTIEKVVTLQKESATSPAVRLVQSDNGGSSDIMSFVSPSSLYLTFHRDGEMFDINGSYLLTRKIKVLESVKFDSAKGELEIRYTAINDRLKPVMRIMRISLKSALKETTGKVIGEFDNFEMKAPILVRFERVN